MEGKVVVERGRAGPEPIATREVRGVEGSGSTCGSGATGRARPSS